MVDREVNQENYKSLVGSLLRFRCEGNYPEFHGAIGMVIKHSKPWSVRVRWVKPVHYATHTEHYKFHGPATVSDFELTRFEIISES